MALTQTLRLHHVGHVVPDIEPVAEMYMRRFGYELATRIVHDPGQTAYVQFLKLPDDSSYLELVAPDGPESKLARTAKRHRGLHHLCYSTAFLEERMQHLVAEGMLLFSDPQPAQAFGGRRICWLIGTDGLLIELVERWDEQDLCVPGS